MEKYLYSIAALCFIVGGMLLLASLFRKKPEFQKMLDVNKTEIPPRATRAYRLLAGLGLIVVGMRLLFQ